MTKKKVAKSKGNNSRVKFLVQRLNNLLQVHSANLDDDLFLPAPPREECPICLIEMPVKESSNICMVCCGKSICGGCILKNAATIDEKNIKKAAKDPPEPPIVLTCPYCRDNIEQETFNEKRDKRMEKGDASAINNMAKSYKEGLHGLPKDEVKALELHCDAAELGSASSFKSVSVAFYNGNVVKCDVQKAKKFAKIAAKKGDVFARHNLGIYEERAGRMGIAVKHWIIAASAGLQGSLDKLKAAFPKHVANQDLARAFRAFQKSRKREWSKDRETWEKKQLPGPPACT